MLAHITVICLPVLYLSQACIQQHDIWLGLHTALPYLMQSVYCLGVSLEHASMNSVAM